MDFKREMDTVTAAERGFEYVVQTLDGEETDCKIQVVGVGSRIHKQAQHKIDVQEENFAKRGKKMDDDQSNDLYIEMLAKCTKGWVNVEEDGKQIEFSYDNAVDMYTKYPALRNQILAAIHDLRAMLEKN